MPVIKPHAKGGECTREQESQSQKSLGSSTHSEQPMQYSSPLGGCLISRDEKRIR